MIRIWYLGSKLIWMTNPFKAICISHLFAVLSFFHSFFIHSFVLLAHFCSLQIGAEKKSLKSLLSLASSLFARLELSFSFQSVSPKTQPNFQRNWNRDPPTNQAKPVIPSMLLKRPISKWKLERFFSKKLSRGKWSLNLCSFTTNSY